MSAATTKNPLIGLSMRRTQAGIPVVRIHYKASPRATADWIEQERKKYTSQLDWDLEMEIQYEAKSGQRIYPEFDVSTHVIPHENIPKRMCRFMSIDPHPRTPHAMLWVGVDRWDDLYVYRELWPSVTYAESRMLRDSEDEHHFTVREYCEVIADQEGNSLQFHAAESANEYATYKKGMPDICSYCRQPVVPNVPTCRDHRGPERIIERYMDQAAKGFIASGEHEPEESYADRYHLYGIECADPIKSHKSGEDLIHTALKPRHHEFFGVWPRLHISDRCPELQLEFSRARYKRTARQTDEKELRQESIDYRVHLLDNLRYILTMRPAWVPNLAS